MSRYVSNVSTQCRSVEEIKKGRQDSLSRELFKLTEILYRTDLTKKLYENLVVDKGSVCFFDQDVGSVEALYVENTIILTKESSQGCQINAMVHELQHHAQVRMGVIGQAIRDLNREEQVHLAKINEADAHAIQAVAIYQLADSKYSTIPYPDAVECMREREHYPYIQLALDRLESLATSTEENIFNPRVLKELHSLFYNNQDFHHRYRYRYIFAYDCLSEPDCFSDRFSLEDLGIDANKAGAVHFPENYLY